MKFLTAPPLFLVAAGTLLFVGCATDYHARGIGGGYSETQFAENVFQVQFQGNGYTSSERATDFALLRSADIALQHGSPFFVLINSDNHVDTSTITTPSEAHTTFNATGNTFGGQSYASGTATTTYSEGETTTINKPSARNTIAVYKERPTDAKFVFDAALVRQSIRAKYRIAAKPQSPLAPASPVPSWTNVADASRLQLPTPAAATSTVPPPTPSIALLPPVANGLLPAAR